VPARVGYCSDANKGAWTQQITGALLFLRQKKTTSLECFFSGPPPPLLQFVCVQYGSISVFPVPSVSLVISGGLSHSTELFLKVKAESCIFLMHLKGHLVIWFCKSFFPYPGDVKESSKWILVRHM
jgi:hypothetical protein